MKARPRLALVLLGILSALAIAEVSLRIFAEELPVRSPWPTVETQLKASQVNVGDAWDVVFLGSSVTEAAVDPRLLTGVTAYNGALPFSTPISHEVWYTSQFLDHERRVVVLGLPAWPFHETEGDDLLASGMRAAVGNPTSIAPRMAAIHHRGVMADWFGLRAREAALKTQLWTPQGHLTAYYEIAGASLAGRMPPFGPPTMSDDVRAAIYRLAEHVQMQGGTFVLMIEPAPYPGEVSEEALERYLASVRDLANDLDVALWDTFSNGWADELYADGLHFNRRGTQAFSKLVDELLAELDRRATS